MSSVICSSVGGIMDAELEPVGARETQTQEVELRGLRWLLSWLLTPVSCFCIQKQGMIVAATYSPTSLPKQYHRSW